MDTTVNSHTPMNRKNKANNNASGINGNTQHLQKTKIKIFFYMINLKNNSPLNTFHI